MHRRRQVTRGLCVAATLALGCVLFLPTGCGGGGGSSPGTGSPGFTTADLGGSWFGPAGTSSVTGGSVGTGTAGMSADPSGGNITEFRLNGAPEAGVTGTATLVNAFLGIFSFARSDGVMGVCLMTHDKKHLLYLDEHFRIGAWEKDATTLSAPYADADVLNSAWNGLATEFDGALAPVETVAFWGTIDPVGTLDATNILGRKAMTDVMPITTLEAANGQFGGDFIDDALPPDTGSSLFLMTPDRKFMAGQFCTTGGIFPTDCLFATWSRP